MLKMDPEERITSEEAMKHSYFDGIREQFDSEDSIRKPINSALNSKRDSNILKKIPSMEK